MARRVKKYSLVKWNFMWEIFWCVFFGASLNGVSKENRDCYKFTYTFLWKYLHKICVKRAAAPTFLRESLRPLAWACTWEKTVKGLVMIISTRTPANLSPTGLKSSRGRRNALLASPLRLKPIAILFGFLLWCLLWLLLAQCDIFLCFDQP